MQNDRTMKYLPDFFKPVLSSSCNKQRCGLNATLCRIYMLSQNEHCRLQIPRVNVFICKQAINRIRFVDLAVWLLGFLGSVSRWCTLPKTWFTILHFMCASLLAFQREDRGQRRTSSSGAAAQPVSLVDCKWDERPPDSLSEPASVLHLRV